MTKKTTYHMSRSEKKKLEIAQRRIFSEEFKSQKVQQIVDKKISVKDVSDLYGVSKMSVYRWLYRYSPHHKQGSIQVVQMESEATKTKQALEALAQLERALGRKQLELEYLEQLITNASSALKIDIKKNFGSVPLSGLDNNQEVTDKK